MKYLEPVAELQNAHIYIREKLILEDVQFSIAKAEFSYIIGKTGAGKSSFLRTLYGELPLKKGRGTVAGYKLHTLRSGQVPSLRRKLGMVFQDFQLFDEWTVERNLGFVLRATGWKDKTARSQRIDEVLNDVRLKDKRKELIADLSGGEQQRIAMARAILNQPELIIGDEPTGNLDPDTADEILYLLRDLAIAHKTSVLISTHDYRLIDKFPARVYECKDGGLVEL
jgi:cell division transport system ATP-binding protein